MPTKKKLTLEQRVAGVKKRLVVISKKSPGQIAAFLKRKRIKGVVGSGDHCPIARYLNFNCTVDGRTAELDSYLEDGGVKYKQVRLGKNVGKVVYNFDEGKYPDLIDRK